MQFVAQSLDNDAPMIVASGRILYSEGDPRRRAVLDETSAASGRGAETVVRDSVKVYEHNGVFALKVYPKMTDAAGRKAPILGSVRNDQVGGEGWPEAALEDVAWFAEAAGRPLDAELRNDVLAGLSAIKKKWNAIARPARSSWSWFWSWFWSFWQRFSAGGQGSEGRCRTCCRSPA